MNRWWWLLLADQEIYQDTAFAAAREAAHEAGATLRSEVPVYGWARRLNRDGKLYPCRDGAQGAVRAWIWYGHVGS